MHEPGREKASTGLSAAKAGSSGKRWSFADLHGSSGAWVILGLSALITLAAWYISNDSVLRVANERFTNKIEDIRTAIEKRMEEQEVALLGGVGLFEASDKVTRQGWASYVASLRLSKYLPGLQGFGYSELVKPRDRADFVNRVRSEGFPEFDIKPAGERDLYSSIIYLEPFADRNLRAFGYDMWSEPTRNEAMARARDTGKPAVSGMVTLVQETESDVQRGFLMYLPLYKKNMPTQTVEQRREAIKGFVYSPFRIKDLMQGILGRGNGEIDFRIYDGDGPVAERLMYDTSGDYTAREYAPGQPFSAQARIDIGGHPWTLNFRVRPGFIPASEANEPLYVAAGGILIDILLFLTITSLSNQRRRAMRMANAMTEELRRSKEKAEHLANSELVLRTTAQESNAKLTEANEGLLKFTSIIAHDLRAPLKRIEAFVDILREDYREKLDEEGQDILTRIERGSSRMRQMLDSMHNYSKYSNIMIDDKPARLDLVIDHALETLGTDLEQAKVNLEVARPCEVKGDAMLLEHVIQNLVSNSLKFRGEDEPVITISAQATQGDIIQLTVTDNGIGIDPEHAKNVFEMFTRLHNEDEYAGTGIGLAVCRKIILDHGGDIAVDTSRPSGTRIIITLQSATADSVSAGPAIAA